MSSKDTLGAPEDAQENAGENGDRDDSSVASKLSKELSNWRRQRNVSRPRRPENGGGSNGSEPARTIRVRGHETLVVRKPKLAPKPSPNQTDNG
ncbi:MAG TPA: hypothetical protein VLL57_02870 [Candidatus Binataceae bacterium]|nr:hypothetical protein [Candidatus Binataceae bacterium]